MTGTAFELELKLECEISDCDTLVDRGSPIPVAVWDRQHLRATYFDTPERRLASEGFVLRIRSEDGDLVQTVKAASGPSTGLFARGEWEKALAEHQLSLGEDAGPIGTLFGPDVIERIGPLFTTDVDRRVGLCDQLGARIEIACDSGAVLAGERELPLCEIELELVEGDASALFTLARAIAERCKVRLGVESKSDRGFRLIDHKLDGAVRADPVRLSRDMTPSEAFAAIAASCLRQYRLNESRFLAQGAAGPVHQARIALRRLRSAFWIFSPLLRDDPRTAQFIEDLRWLTAQWSPLREIDVLLPRLGEAERMRLTAIRAEAVATLGETLDSARARLLPLELVEWLTVGGWRSGEAGSVSGALPVFAAERLDRLRKRIKRRGKSLAKHGPEELHQLRKDAKKLRYATEFFVALYPGRKARTRMEDMLSALEDIQDLLGELNDETDAGHLAAQWNIPWAEVVRRPGWRRKRLSRARKNVTRLLDVKRFWRSAD